MANRYQVCTKATPGAQLTIEASFATIKAARHFAADRNRGRGDLKYQDVRIELADGSLVEYAGPCR